MGLYLNPGAMALRQARASKIYVDKTGLLEYLDEVVNTEQRFVCVSRPRRFGKTMSANMISAYYDRTVDGATEFSGLAIIDSPAFDTHRNSFDVIRLNMAEFLNESDDVDAMIATLSNSVLWELLDAYPDVRYFNKDDLARSFADIFVATQRQFVFVIDEWDCLMREREHNQEAQKRYLDFLRGLLKDRPYVALAYMTGILPIKKYGRHSALNMFSEFSMTEPVVFAPYMGFTDAEVHSLCDTWGMSYEETRSWYDGYKLIGRTGAGGLGVVEAYSPKSIVEAMTRHSFGDYWNKTETFEALRAYIDLNFDGLRDAVIALLAGGHRHISTGTFSNDMTTFATSDDVLTLLVHLGYLAYDQQTAEVFIPNREVALEFVSSMSTGGWDEVTYAVRESAALLQAIVAGDEIAVAHGVERAHQETSHISYNSEEALSYTLSLALFAARQWYTVVRELPAGKGFADLVFVPRRAYADKPAIVAELKWDESAETAIRQIHEKCYPDVLSDWMRDGGDVILAGVSYDKKTRKHSCLIEHLS